MVYTQKKLVLALGLIAALILAACAGPQATPQPNNEVTPPAVVGGETTTPTMTGVVARVNGEEIQAEQILAVQETFALQGIPLDDEQAIEQVVNQVLLSQAASNAGVTLTTQETQAQMEEILAQQGASVSDWGAEIEAQGLNYEEELETIRQDFIVREYLESVTSQVPTDVSQEEARAFYDEYAAQSPEEMPPFAEVEEQIIDLLAQEAQQAVIQEHITQLRMDADIELVE